MKKPNPVWVVWLENGPNPLPILICSSKLASHYLKKGFAKSVTKVEYKELK